MKKCLVLIASLVFSASADAQMYKWVDKDGKVRYGDMPPAGTRATPLKGSRAPAAAAPAPESDAKGAKGARSGPMTPVEQEAAFRKRRLDAQKAQEKEAKLSQEADAKRQNCETAKDAMRQLQSGQPISKVNAQGERYVLDEKQMDAEVERARRLQRDSCPS